MRKQLKDFYGVTELSTVELEIVNGGSEGKPTASTGFWYDAVYVIGVISHGFVTFGTEGGRNAGLVVR